MVTRLPSDREALTDREQAQPREQGAERGKLPEQQDALAAALGWFSLALGAAQLAAPGRLARLVGVADSRTTRTVLRACGVREIAAGAGILGVFGGENQAPWLWGRVAGDAMDLSLLAMAMSRDGGEGREIKIPQNGQHKPRARRGNPAREGPGRGGPGRGHSGRGRAGHGGRQYRLKLLGAPRQLGELARFTGGGIAIGAMSGSLGSGRRAARRGRAAQAGGHHRMRGFVHPGAFERLGEFARSGGVGSVSSGGPARPGWMGRMRRAGGPGRPGGMARVGGAGRAGGPGRPHRFTRTAEAARQGMARKGGLGRLGLTAGAVAGVAVVDVIAARRCRRAGRGGVEVPARRMHVTASTTIRRPAAELYRAWHDFEGLPTFMYHLESVQSSNGHSHWRARGPAGTRVEWDAEIVDDRPNELISWRSVGGARVENAGTVRFVPAPGNRGTEVHVELEYGAPGGVGGVAVARMLGEEPGQQIADDLRRFKQLMETGEIVRSEGSPAGAKASNQLHQRPARPLD